LLTTLHYRTLHWKTLYSGLSKSKFKDHYGDVVITQCRSKIAEINEFSASDEMYSPDQNKPLRTNALENR